MAQKMVIPSEPIHSSNPSYIVCIIRGFNQLPTMLVYDTRLLGGGSTNGR